jgi:hypothetical protein
MGNPATLQTAPPFTPETGRFFGRLGAEANRRKRKAILENKARPDIEPEINRIARAMKKLPVTSEEHDRLSKKLKELWSLAFPTQGAVRGRSSRSVMPSVEPLPTPQAAPGPEQPTAPSQ